MTEPRSPVRVLIVDDDQFVRTLLKDVLVPQGHDCLEAKDGAEAIAQVRDGRPDVVILDLFMPTMSGMQALKEIRAAHPDSRVVVISSLSSEALVAEALAAGAAGFVTKPFHPLEIQEAVQQALATTT